MSMMPLKILATTLCLASASVMAQWPAGTPERREGAYPSPMGNPTPSEEMETHRDAEGRVRTEDGREVKGMPHDEGTPNANMEHTEERHSEGDGAHGSADPGERE